jgi:hypothetical protein
MSREQRAFETLMRIDGHTNFAMKNGKYVNSAMQVRWRWFRTGWELRGLSGP